MKFAFYTLGCKVNQYETQAMEQLLTEMGHCIGSFSEDCDGYVINTCSVTAIADRKARTVIRRCRREHPRAVIGVCGCYAQHASVAELGVDVVGGSANRRDFVQRLVLAVQGTVPSIAVDESRLRREFELLPAGGLEGRTRAMLKVQDGCNNFCSYCIIPYTRGPVRSCPVDTAAAQAAALAEKGYREIVITGIEIASWGVDLPGKPSLTQLIGAICRAVPEIRIRLGSLEPRIVTETFCAEMQRLPNLCPQFHLSMQSGCDRILKAMHRHYDTARYYQSVSLLKAAFPGCAVTTDMIVAFPGETEAEFQESLDFVRKCGFADMHIFPYSRRPGTPADTLPCQHGNDVKEARSRAAIAVAQQLRQEFLGSMVSSRQAVLFEEPEAGCYTGHTPNYIKVYVRGENLHNQLHTVELLRPYRDGMLGELIPDRKENTL